MLKKFLKSFVYAFQGVIAALKAEPNMKIQFALALVAICAGFYFDITRIEWCIVLLAIAIVVGFEMMNTAIESLVDLVTREQSPHAGKIKDIAAGAVLLVSVVALAAGILVFGKYIF